MEYDFRNRTGPPQSPMYGRPSTAAPQPHPMYGQSPGLYPRPGQLSAPWDPPSHHAPSNAGIRIRVAIKPEYPITPPPQLSTLMGLDIPRSTFNFDFDLEKKVLAEAENESQNWSRLGLENLPSRMPGYNGDPVMNKYATSGFNREAVALAVANYGDNPIKVKEFVEVYTLLKEMGFSSNSVADALLMNDNDKDKAAAQLLGNSF
ncbi:unnamed protein product [Withania somnifera]